MRVYPSRRGTAWTPQPGVKPRPPGGPAHSRRRQWRREPPRLRERAWHRGRGAGACSARFEPRALQAPAPWPCTSDEPSLGFKRHRPHEVPAGMSRGSGVYSAGRILGRGAPPPTTPPAPARAGAVTQHLGPVAATGACVGMGTAPQLPPR